MTRLHWLFALALGACSNAADTPSVGTLERDRIELVAEANEPIAEILVVEGDEVAVDALLVRFEGGRVAAAAAQARAARAEAGARLAEMRRGPRIEEIAEARALAAGAESRVATARTELARAQALASRGVASAAQLDAAQLGFDAALAERDATRARLDAREAGATAVELARAEGAHAAAEAALADAELRLARLELRAPRAGRVDALPFERGERPPVGAVVAVLLAEGAPWARVYVPEPVRVRLAPGARAEVEIDGFDAPFAGRLRSIAHDAAFTPYYALTQRDRSRLAYVAEVDLTGPEAAELPTGVPVQVTFPIETTP
jgi:HlyD family secretion protein